jgi:hypothetical protein
MPAGYKFKKNLNETIHEYCRVDTLYRSSGGFNLVIDNMAEGAVVSTMAPLSIDFDTRKATVVKNVRMADNAVAADTALKIAKGSLAYAGMFVGTGSAGATVSAIDKSNEKYDVLTLSAALGEAVSKGDVLFEASAQDGTTVKNKASFLNYAFTKVEPGASVTVVYRAFEVRETKLIDPISKKDKETLKGFYLFIP